MLLRLNWLELRFNTTMTMTVFTLAEIEITLPRDLLLLLVGDGPFPFWDQPDLAGGSLGIYWELIWELIWP